METETKSKLDTKKVIITVLLVLLTAVAVGGGVYYALNSNFQKEREVNEKALSDVRDQLKTLEEKDKKSEASTTGSSTQASTPVSEVPVYKNSQYGFQLTLTNNWKDYKVLTKDVDMGSFTTKAFYFELPVKDSGWQTADSTHDAGYASLFSVAVFTKAQWTATQAEEGPKDDYLGENSNYVFGYSHAQAGTNELAIPNAEIANIIKTYKAL